MIENPPIEWFRNPGLTELTPLTVTPEGRVYGHIAAWGQDHLSFPSQRIKPPRSLSDYKWFHSGSVDVLGDDGEVVTISAGKITQGGGHAGLALSASETARYYDDSTSIVAMICAFDEDPNGIAFSGAILPGVGELAVKRLKACGGVSGDWRQCSPGGGLDLLACLAVPTGGFAIPRARVASGSPLALVAAGMVQPASFGRKVDPSWSKSEPIQSLNVGAIKGNFAAPRYTFTLNGVDLSETFSMSIDPERLAATAVTPPPAPTPATLAAQIDRAIEARERKATLAAQRESLLAEVDDTAARHSALVASLDDTAARKAKLLAELDGAEDGDYLSKMPPALQKEWLTGKVAARIAWNTPGSMTRCIAEAKDHEIPERQRGGLCQNLKQLAEAGD